MESCLRVILLVIKDNMFLTCYSISIYRLLKNDFHMTVGTSKKIPFRTQLNKGRANSKIYHRFERFVNISLL